MESQGKKDKHHHQTTPRKPPTYPESGDNSVATLTLTAK